MPNDVYQRNNVTVTGNGPDAMLFAHGFGCDQTMWRFVAPDFEADHKVVTYDLTGAGGSDLSAYDPEQYRTLEGHAGDILLICEALDLKDVTLVGHSVSAITSVLAANREPERFRRLVLVAPSPSFLNDGDYQGGFSREDLEGLLALMDQNYLGWAQQMAPTIVGRAPTEPGAEELTKSFCRTDPEIARHFARVTFMSDHRADMAALDVPSLILHCSEDALAPMSVADWMRTNVPRAKVEVLPVVGHCPHLTDPRLTSDAIRRYLDDT